MNTAHAHGPATILDEDTLQLLEPAIALARELGHDPVDRPHVLLADLEHEGSLMNVLAARAALATDRLASEIVSSTRRSGNGANAPRIRQRLLHLVRSCAHQGDRWRALVAEILWDHDDELSQRLRELGIECRTRDVLGAPHAAPVENSPAPFTLDSLSFCRDLTAAARRGEIQPLIGRRAELADLVEVLAQVQMKNALLLGEPGVGKTALAEELARLVAAGELHELDIEHVIELDMGALLAGTHLRGAFEERIRELIEALANRRNVVLFIDEFHLAVGAGRTQDGPDLANLLKPVLARGSLQVIAATTEAEYRRFVENDEALVRRFATITVREPTRGETLEILQRIKARFEVRGVSFDTPLLRAIVDLTERHLPHLRNPSKSVQVLDRAGARRALKAGPDAPRPCAVEIADVAAVIAARTRIPDERMRSSAEPLAARLSAVLQRRLAGQGALVEELMRAVTATHGQRREKPRLVLRVTESERSRGYELAGALAEALCGDEKRVVRVASSQLAAEQACERLIGPAAGLVGFEQGGVLLSEPVRKDPHAIVVLEGLSSAHPLALQLLREVLQRAVLLDNHGRTIRFGECAILVVTPESEADCRELATDGWDAELDFAPLDDERALEFARCTLRDGLQRSLMDERPTPELTLADTARADLLGEIHRARHRPASIASFLRARLARPLLEAARSAAADAAELTLDHSPDGAWSATPTGNHEP